MNFLLLLYAPFLSLIVSSSESETPMGKERTKYKFSQAWVWEYQNDWIQPGLAGHRGEITVYYDSLSRAWLFDHEAFGESGRGFDFILGTYSGQYTFCFRDEKGKKRKTVRSVGEVASSRADNQLVENEFSANYKPTDNKKTFGKNPYGWPLIEGKEYVFQASGSGDKTSRFLANSEIDFQPIIYFNFLEGEVKLPFHFPTDVPVGKVLLEDYSTYADGKKIILRLKSAGDTNYHINLSDYK